MSWSPERGLQFSLFSKKGRKFKYVGKEVTHTPGILRAIPAGVMNRLVKLISIKTSLHNKGVDKVYPDHANALHEAGFARPNLPTMGGLWIMQDEKLDIENEEEPDVNKKET